MTHKSSSVLVECGSEVVQLLFQHSELAAVLGVYSYVCKTWMDAALLCFNNKVKVLENTIDLSAVINLYGGTINVVLQGLRYKIPQQKLKVTGTFEISDNTLHLIAKKNPHLTHLFLYGCRHLTYEGVETSCKLIPGLKHLDILDCSRIGKADSVKLESFVPHVEYLPTATPTTIASTEVEDPVLLIPEEGEPLYNMHLETLQLPLGVPTTMQTVKKLYRKLVDANHPDKATLVWGRAPHIILQALDSAYEYFSALPEWRATYF